MTRRAFLATAGALVIAPTRAVATPHRMDLRWFEQQCFDDHKMRPYWTGRQRSSPIEEWIAESFERALVFHPEFRDERPLFHLHVVQQRGAVLIQCTTNAKPIWMVLGDDLKIGLMEGTSDTQDVPSTCSFVRRIVVRDGECSIALAFGDGEFETSCSRA